MDRILVGGEIFRIRPDRPWGPPSLLYNGYCVSFSEVKRPGRGVAHPHSCSAEVKEREQLYLYTPSGPSWLVIGVKFSFIIIIIIIIIIIMALQLDFDCCMIQIIYYENDVSESVCVSILRLKRRVIYSGTAAVKVDECANISGPSTSHIFVLVLLLLFRIFNIIFTALEQALYTPYVNKV